MSWAPSFFLADFALPVETVQALRAFADRHEIEDATGFIDQVQHTCRVFLAQREDEAQRMAEGETNKRLIELCAAAAAMGEQLQHPEVLAKLAMIAHAADHRRFRSVTTSFLRDLRAALALVAAVGQELPAAGGRGRPRGSRNRPARHLAFRLCEILGRHGVKATRATDRKTGRPTGNANELFRIVKTPLHIGDGEIAATIDAYIREKNKTTG